MSDICDDEAIRGLYLSALRTIEIADEREFLTKKYAETTGESAYALKGEFGGMQLRLTWKRGVVEGPATLVANDGSTVCTFSFRDASPHGRATFFCKGARFCSMSVMDGIYMGDCEFFRNGRIFYTGDFFHGDVNGQGILYYPTGSIMYEGEFRYGYADGSGTFHTPEGDEVFSDSWKRGSCANVQTTVVTPPMVVCIQQTRDEEAYTEEIFSRRLSYALPYMKTFDLVPASTPVQNPDVTIKKRMNYTSSDTSDYHSDSAIPIPRGELTRHIRDQQVTVRTSDEDVMALPVVGEEQPAVRPSKRAVKTFKAEVIPSQPVEVFREPRECLQPPPISVPEKYVMVASSDEWKRVPRGVTDLTVDTECFNDPYMKYMKLSQFRHLKSITFNDYCCCDVTTLALRNCQYLESLVVGDDCFSPLGVRNASEYKYVLKALKKDPEGGSFYAGYDYYLASIQIGRQSFLKFSHFSLYLLPNLRSIVIGEVSAYDDVNLGSFNFLSVLTVVLDNLPALESVVIGSYSFTEVRSVTLSNLPALRHLELGHQVFRGDDAWAQNAITLHALPSLSTLILRDSVGCNMRYLSMHDCFSSRERLSFQIGAVFSQNTAVSYEGCPQDAIDMIVQKVRMA
ncbi:hypothetical protein WA577_005510 [Blastocystis sp. JDR]